MFAVQVDDPVTERKYSTVVYSIGKTIYNVMSIYKKKRRFMLTAEGRLRVLNERSSWNRILKLEMSLYSCEEGSGESNG